MIKRHPFEPEIQAAILSEAEHVIRSYLGKYVNLLPSVRQERIFQIAKQLLEVDI